MKWLPNSAEEADGESCRHDARRCPYANILLVRSSVV